MPKNIPKAETRVKPIPLLTACAFLGASVPMLATAQTCNVPVLKMLAQKSLGLSVMEKSLPDYQKRSGTRIEINYFGENDRRSKSRLDASTGAGSYQIYYVDEANVAEFASAGWIVPLLKYYPKDADYDDFLPGRRAVASYKGVAYFAPLIGGGDFLFYRRDILEKAHLPVPKTLDELVADIKKLNAPPNMYGWVARGQRGSGMNVWRWAPFMLAEGGTWTDRNQAPSFNSPGAVKATQLYRDLFKYAPPGSSTYDWSNALEAFRSGKVAFMIESTPFADWMEDPTKSSVADKVGYVRPPAPLPSAAYGHGLAISSVGAKDECTRQAAGKFIAWATGKDQEQARLRDNVFSDYNRSSTIKSDYFQKHVKPQILAGLNDTNPVTKVTIWSSPQWPDIGDNLGIALEEVFTGTQPDVQATLNDAVQYARDAMEHGVKK
ncbi:sugar ABC transporter substrate-binding protein [bacterium M00.F.Ca.ET.228.01.1.1]|nr:sugar ABC transporter substrate-binding protein [Paraburkholderia phenoliruptrix]MBW9127512.1 sugar ABC transporter substrate-binding protein [Paraburkholderia ginsengiterrae]TGP46452.1 sugar ABC transporter substrate-binding protein [bacterium M00.F.Ca.ET.228.01.1.1]TGS04324.1 sugar ABC transporter substrate-binding protein [bacterium M00.F.Ca.ET.191.01.1.1]TGU07746.1 sugar ABC transporter substrate-binding protein [bacterium M00.F.Ca.ET.155.01.1.1]